MNLILIHGRDQQGKSEVDLRKTWIKSWEEGLAKNNLSLPENLNIIFPYYGDLIDSLYRNIHGSETMTGVIARGGTISPAEATVYYEILLELVANSGVTNEDIQKNYNGEILNRGFLNIGWVQAILETLDNLEALGNLAINLFTADVAFYLNNATAQKQINDFIATSFNNDPTVVVGHSLGSVAGYNVLKESPELDIKKYVTLGSPLGIKAIKNKLTPPIGMPVCIKNGWYNAFDDRDVVALNSLDSRHFNLQPSIYNTSHVDNPSENRHDIAGYLSDPEVAKVIYDALN